MKRHSHITLNDIAKRLGVSRVTVSKALRGHPDISEETVRRVRKVTEELGYSPNIIARSLSARRSNMIGLVVPKIAHFFFGSVIEGVYNMALENNYETILTVSQENAELERKHLQTLVSMRVDGIIISISQTTRDVGVFTWIRKMGFPLLFLDRRPEPPLPGFNSVLADDKGGAFKAVEQAIKVGYRKIACIGGNTHINIGKNRLLGFETAMKQHGIPIKKEWIITGGFGKNVGYDGFMQLHSSGRAPDFIFAMTYPIALGVYEAAKELGLRIPDDIDLISFGDSDVTRVISPALSCVAQPSFELGSKAAELMLKTILHPDSAGEQHLVLPADLLIRETCTGKNTVVAQKGNGQKNAPPRALKEAV
ncbi:MAG: LacI family DNA-binding transcriptional regulator [Bacteroidota bacterium]